jgi:Flp pilus assembly pilin Flp
VSLSLDIQYTVVAVLVAISALYTFRKLAPQLTTRWQATAAAMLQQSGNGRAVLALGRWSRPSQATGNCGDGCGTCGSCGTPQLPRGGAEERPLEFRPRQNSSDGGMKL